MGRRRRRKLTFMEKLNLNPDINRGLLAVLLFIAGVLAVLSFFGMAGVAGEFIDALLAITFGQVRYVFPIILLLVSILIIKDLDYDYQPTHWLGSIIFFLSFNGLVHLHNPPYKMIDLAIQGQGGGLVGLVLSWVLGTYIGYWGGLVILIGLILIAIIFLFNTSLAEIVHLHRRLFSAMGWVGMQIIKMFSLFVSSNLRYFRVFMFPVLFVACLSCSLCFLLFVFKNVDARVFKTLQNVRFLDLPK